MLLHAQPGVGSADRAASDCRVASRCTRVPYSRGSRGCIQVAGRPPRLVQLTKRFVRQSRSRVPLSLSLSFLRLANPSTLWRDAESSRNERTKAAQIGQCNRRNERKRSEFLRVVRLKDSSSGVSRGARPYNAEKHWATERERERESDKIVSSQRRPPLTADRRTGNL